MKTITKQKSWEEIEDILSGVEKVYLLGCGTCATMCQTGGKSEILQMKDKLEGTGRQVTGWMVIPTACDELTRDALKEDADNISTADVIAALTCAFGVQTVTIYADKPVYPMLNTLFVGMEETPGHFIEVCMQCGTCVLAKTAGICPLVRCAKSLLNGPCGGSAGGKCEIDPDTPCAWQTIIDRLQTLGRLEILEEVMPPHDWSTSQSGGQRKIILGD